MCCISIFIAQYGKFFGIQHSFSAEKFKFLQIDLHSIRRITIQIKTIKFSPPKSGKPKRFFSRKKTSFSNRFDIKSNPKSKYGRTQKARAPLARV